MAIGTVNGVAELYERPDESARTTLFLQNNVHVDIVGHSADNYWLLVSSRQEGRVSIGWVQAHNIDFDRDTIAEIDLEQIELSDAQFAEIIRACRQWVEGHPNSDEPLTLVRGKVLSPRALANEMERKTELGRPFLGYLARESVRTGDDVAEPIYRAIAANQSR